MKTRWAVSLSIATALAVASCSGKGKEGVYTAGAGSCFPAGVTPAFYGCTSQTDCVAGTLCIDNGGDHHYYCKPMCTGTTGTCAVYVGNGMSKPGPGGGGACPMAVCPDGQLSGIAVCEAPGSNLAPSYGSATCCGGGTPARKGPCTDPNNVAGTWKGCFPAVSCGSCSTSTPSCFSFTISQDVADNGGLFTDDQGNTFALDLSTCTAAVAQVGSYGAGTTGATCSAGQGTTTIDFNAGHETTGLQCPTDNCMSCGNASASISR